FNLMYVLTLVFSFFPYTTLFRSERFGVLYHAVYNTSMRSHCKDFNDLFRGSLRRPRYSSCTQSTRLFATLVIAIQETGITGGFTDRKSTRLNSSHVSISYAVFCL